MDRAGRLALSHGGIRAYMKLDSSLYIRDRTSAMSQKKKNREKQGHRKSSLRC